MSLPENSSNVLGFALEGRGGLFVEGLERCHSNVIDLSLPLLRQMWFNRLNYAKSALAMPETLSRWASWLKADFLLIWKAGILAR